MSDALIRVNEQPFFGRVEEQKQFRAVLDDLLRNPPGETLPYIVLLYGDGGIGKTTLARRFRDIARGEEPYRGLFELLWVDWEREQRLRLSLSVGREHVGAEALFDTLHDVARSRWPGAFAAYEAMLRARDEATQAADMALSGAAERDELAALRGVDRAAVRRFLRLPALGEGSAELLVRLLRAAGVQADEAQARRLRGVAERHLHVRLTSAQYDLFVNPHARLAQALGEGFRRVAEARPLLVVLDTYEIVDRADLWLRQVLLAAGPRLGWLLAGRNDLERDRQFGESYFQGYRSDFPYRLLGYDVKRLAEADVCAYFAARVPQRPLDDATATALSRATRGIPLAVREAADIWAAGKPLSAIVGDIHDGTPRGEIVPKMTARYLLHCLQNEQDRRALYTLALARGDGELLHALLTPAPAVPTLDTPPATPAEPDLPALRQLFSRFFIVDELAALCTDLGEEFEDIPGETRTAKARELVSHFERRGRLDELIKAGRHERPSLPWPALASDPLSVAGDTYPFELEPYLLELERRYASVHLEGTRLEGARLHEEPATFLLEDLRGRLRHVEWVRVLVARGMETLWARIERLGRYHATIEARCEDEDWARAAQALTFYLFWLDEEEGWHWLVPRFVEALAYSHDLRRGLLRAMAVWEPQMEHQGRKRLKVLQAVNEVSPSIEAAAALLAELEQYPTRDWLRGEGEPERSAILALRRGRLAFQRKQHGEALRWYEQAERGLPKEGHALRRQLGEAQYELAGALMWPEGPRNYVYSAEAERILMKVIGLLPDNQGAWYRLGIVQDSAGRKAEAIATFQRATSLDPKLAAAHNGLGNVYRAVGQSEAAQAAYQQAITLDPQDAAPYYGLGSVCHSLGRNIEAATALQRAVELAPDDAIILASFAAVLRALKRNEEAEGHLARGRATLARESEYNRACFEAICGNVDEALALLEQALDKAPGLRDWAQRDPDFEGLRDHPRFRALVGLDEGDS